jgi:hypothetical protein
MHIIHLTSIHMEEAMKNSTFLFFIFPLFFDVDYGKGRFFVLTIPDTYSDLYQLPTAVLNHICKRVSQEIPVHLEEPARVCLFAYDNRTFVTHSFLPLVPLWMSLCLLSPQN